MVSTPPISSLKHKIEPLVNIDPKIQYDVSRIQTDLQTVYTDLTNMKTNLPHTNEVAIVQENVKKLCNDFTELQTSLGDQVNKLKLVTTEDLHKAKDEMIKTATEKVTEHANNHLTENSVSKEEFENLKQRIEKVLGADEIAERMEILSTIFDSTQIKTLNWQCRLIKLLNGGLAPDAEEDLIISQGIPKTTCEKFLKKLTDLGISESRNVLAYYLMPDNEWIYSYVENPDWLQNRLESTVKKENEYQNYIRDNLNLIEEGLLLEKSEYQLATGKIDFICRDKNGKAVGLEIKYPAATSSVKRQILGYKNDYEQKSGITDSRFIVIAPKIPERLKLLLIEDNIEYREIEF
ncbi:MAG: hypothetical protein COV65_04445 [Nitrosopumilales archaeon CG11_big_fil_rev_8_21_14_0_20_33_24]|nr:MAG: hypothetical protein COV65_04445 [Nitrosopumilales archaeon CG11_big_fil_rev_8_21_14_0_20_33_24]PIY90679.1 MAG: hypothetical protein COY74_00110 [Nitrosopumilales archaeon CG_4_10_14_0_8_um_filter_34_8]